MLTISLKWVFVKLSMRFQRLSRSFKKASQKLYEHSKNSNKSLQEGKKYFAYKQAMEKP